MKHYLVLVDYIDHRWYEAFDNAKDAQQYFNSKCEEDDVVDCMFILAETVQVK